MALEDSKFQAQAEVSKRIVSKSGTTIRLIRQFPTKIGGPRQHQAAIPIDFKAVVLPRSLTDSFSRFEEMKTGENMAIIVIFRILQGFIGVAEGFSFSSGAGAIFSDGRLVEAESEQTEPYISLGDSFEFGDRKFNIRTVSSINPDGAYPLLFQCLVS